MYRLAGDPQWLWVCDQMPTVGTAMQSTTRSVISIKWQQAMLIQPCGLCRNSRYPIDVTHCVYSWRNDAFTFHPVEAYTMELRRLFCACDLTSPMCRNILTYNNPLTSHILSTQLCWLHYCKAPCWLHYHQAPCWHTYTGCSTKYMTSMTNNRAVEASW